jgi:calcineurin-like phosphoesterase family protein
MYEKFYISDTHFSHDNILKFEAEKRPFDTIEEHDEELIKRWNAVVGPKDVVYHLGDVCFKPATRLDPVMKQLNGTKHLILGNHDTLPMPRYLRWFDTVHSMMENKKDGVLFSHYPCHSDQLGYRYKVNVHGHCHSYLIKDERYINISCEYTDLAPMSHDDLMVEIINRIGANDE